MSTIASNTEKGSCESAEARLSVDRGIRNWLIRIDRPRAQKRRPPPDAGTGTRIFNAPAAFSPHPAVTGSVIGSKHPSNRPFWQPCPPDEPEYGRAQRDDQNVLSRLPSRRPKSALTSARLRAASDPRVDTFLPKEESGGERQHLSTTLTRLQPRRTGVPTVKPIQDSAQELDSEARVIITQALSNKTARGHAVTEASSRSAHHAPIDPYSITCAM
jgi:hypothetical protein